MISGSASLVFLSVISMTANTTHAVDTSLTPRDWFDRIVPDAAARSRILALLPEPPVFALTRVPARAALNKDELRVLTPLWPVVLKASACLSESPSTRLVGLHVGKIQGSANGQPLARWHALHFFMGSSCSEGATFNADELHRLCGHMKMAFDLAATAGDSLARVQSGARPPPGRPACLVCGRPGRSHCICVWWWCI